MVLSVRVIECRVQKDIAFIENNLMPDDSFAENEFTKIANLYNENTINIKYYGGQMEGNYVIKKLGL